MIAYSTLIDIAFGTSVYFFGPELIGFLGASGSMWLAIYSAGAAFAWMQLGVSRVLLSAIGTKDEDIM